MNRLLGALVLAAAWLLLRRSTAHRVERVSRNALPVGTDGIIAGAETIDRRAVGRRAVLLLHGFGDTPQTVHYLADHLHGLGFSIRAPLLAGHGRTLREFGGSTAAQWLAAARTELASLQREYGVDSVGVVGVSMGGALAVILAGEGADNGASSPRPRDARHGAGASGATPAPRPPASLVLIAPYLSMRPRARRLATWHWAFAPLARYLPSREDASIRDAAERRNNRGFGTVTPRLLNELQRIVNRADASLPAVTVPTLVIHSRGDNRIDPAAAEASFARLGATEKRLEWTDGGGHVITVDFGREHVFALTAQWLSERVHDSPTPSSSSTS